MANNSAEALNELRAFQGSRRKSTDILKDQETQLGLPSAQQRQAGLRAAITNTENLIRAVEPSVAGRTGGQNVTEAQKTRLVGLERAPLDDTFRTQQQAYGEETQSVDALRRDALQKSQLQIAEDDNQQSNLSGLYSTLYQREQDAAAKAERDRAFAEEQRVRRASEAAAARMASLYAGGGATATPAAPQTDPVQQTAYNDVATRISKSDDNALKSDFNATAKSAARGNLKDKYKLDIYRQMRPDLFSNMGSEAIGNFSQLRF